MLSFSIVESLNFSFNSPKNMRPQNSPDRQFIDSKCFEIFLYLLILTLVSLLVLACALIIMSQPIPPIVDLNSVQVLHFNISSSSLLTACIRIQFSLQNPNKEISFSIESITAYLVYQRQYSFLSTSIDSFHLDSGAEGIVVHANLDATSIFVQNHVSDDMRAELMNLEVLNFDVRIYSKTWFKPGSSWIWGYERMWIDCQDVTVGFLSNKTIGTMLNSPRRCQVGLSFI